MRVGTRKGPRFTQGEFRPLVLEVRARHAYEAAHIPGARHLPRGQLELRVAIPLTNPTAYILAACELTQISTPPITVGPQP